MYCDKPSFGNLSSKTDLWLFSFSRLSWYPSHFPTIISMPFKTTPCSFFICLIWVNSWVAFSRAIAILNMFYYFTLRWFKLLVELVHCQRIGCCYCFLCRFVCMSVSTFVILPSWCFPRLLCLLLSLYHLRHRIISQHVSLYNGSLRPVVIPKSRVLLSISPCSSPPTIPAHSQLVLLYPTHSPWIVF